MTMESNLKQFFVLQTSTMTSEVNEIFGVSTQTQTFINNSINPLEVAFTLPLSKESILHKLAIKLEDKTVYTKIIEKEKAKEKYQDSIASGNLSLTGNYSEDDDELYQLNIGNIPPKKEFTITTSIIQLIESEKQQYCFTISPGVFPFITDYPKNQELLVTISSSNGPISSLSSNQKYSQSVNNNNNEHNVLLTFNIQNQKQFKIFFTTPDHNDIQLFEEYDNNKNLYAYTLHYHYHHQTKKEDDVNETPGVFYFLLDQSGSMEGENIKLAKNALLLFLQSLPLGSHFYLMGFGSETVSYTKKLMPYSEEGLNESEIIKTIKGLEASLGGTNLLLPLSQIYKSDSKLKLSRNIFVLTDGMVSDSNLCCDLISKHNDEFRIHSIGIGKDFDEKFIGKIGKLGKGTSSCVPNISELNLNVVNALNKALRPYLKNVCISIGGDKMIEYPPSKMGNSNLLYADDFYNYSFISKSQINRRTKVTFYAFDPLRKIDIEETKSLLITQLRQGNILHQTIVGQYLKNNEKYKIDKKDVLNLSIEYQVLSDATTLIAEVELNEKNNMPMHVIDFTNIKAEKNVCYRKKIKMDMTNNNYNMGYLLGRVGGKACRKASQNRSRSRDDIDQDNEDYDEDKDKDSDSDNDNETNAIKTKRRSGLYNNIIQSQNMFDGSWNENSHTKCLMKLMSEVYAKISTLLSKENKLDKSLKSKIIFTYLVMRYIIEKYANKIEETRLIINKAKKYLVSNYLSYEDLNKSLI